MAANEKSISMEAGGIAAFTLVQVLIEKLVDLETMSQEDALEVVDQSIHLNARVLSDVRGKQNKDAVYLLEQLRESLSLVFKEK